MTYFGLSVQGCVVLVFVGWFRHWERDGVF